MNDITTRKEIAIAALQSDFAHFLNDGWHEEIERISNVLSDFCTPLFSPNSSEVISSLADLNETEADVLDTLMTISGELLDTGKVIENIARSYLQHRRMDPATYGF